MPALSAPQGNQRKPSGALISRSGCAWSFGVRGLNRFVFDRAEMFGKQ